MNRRKFITDSASAAIVAYATAHVMAAKEAAASRLRGAGAQNSAPSVTSITNARTGTKYIFLKDAIAGASANDEILIPAGTYAPDYPQYPYAYWEHTNTGAGCSGFGGMYVHIPLTFTGVGTANNGRVKWEMPYCTLTADVPANTAAGWTAQVDSTALCVPLPATINACGAPTMYLSLLNPLSTLGGWLGNCTYNIVYDSITPTTLVNCSASPAWDLPAGTILRMGVWSFQAYIISNCANPGLTFNNIEILDAAGYDTNSSPIYMLGNAPGITGSFTANGCYFHNCPCGPRGSPAPIGQGSFIHLYETELYQNGCSTQRTHNIYVPPCDEYIMNNCYSHQVNDVHLVKTRAFSSYITYNRITGEHTTVGTPGFEYESANIDVSEGGLTYIIGNQIAQSVYPTTAALEFCAEDAFNPTQECYCINNTIRASPLGYGLDPNIGPFPPYSQNALTIGNVGVRAPFALTPGQVSGGALPQRTYVAVATNVDSTGAETQAPSDVSGSKTEPITISANSLLHIPSVEASTGAAGWNLYQGYADPAVYPPDNNGPGGYFWDVAETQPVYTESAGGSLPSTGVGFLVTYQFGAVESVKMGYMGSGYGQGYSVTFGMYVVTTANTLFTIASPPSVPGATGWNIHARSNYDSYNGYLPGAPMVKQNASPIPIGTPWVEPTTGVNNVGFQFNQNWFKQNTSPIAIGTAWTEPTSGMATGNNPFKLNWKQRTALVPYGTYNEWFAIAPSTLTSYDIDIVSLYGIYDCTVFVVSGATGFDPDPSIPTYLNSGGTVNTTDATTMVIACLPGAAGPQSGFTGIGLSAEYKNFSSPQTGVAIVNAAGGQVLVDALTGSGLTVTAYTNAITVESSNTPNGTNMSKMTISANAGDYIIFFGGAFVGPTTIDSPYPWTSLALTGSPIGYVDNNLLEYYCTINPGGGVLAPTGYLTLGTHNLLTNWSTNNNIMPVTFNTPVPGFVNESNYDYNLVSGSAARGAGTNPGSSPESYSLAPVYQISYVGLPTPGTPIPPLVARPNTGGVFDAGAFEYGI